jgi:hypothetical protein
MLHPIEPNHLLGVMVKDPTARQKLHQERDMPFLDAKALETDPDGMAFLRAVLKPDAGSAGSVREPLARPKPGLSFEAPLPTQDRVSLASIPTGTATQAPAA